MYHKITFILALESCGPELDPVYKLIEISGLKLVIIQLCHIGLSRSAPTMTKYGLESVEYLEEPYGLFEDLF